MKVAVDPNLAPAEPGPFAGIPRLHSRKRVSFAEEKLGFRRTEPDFAVPNSVRAETSNFRSYQNGVLMTGRLSSAANFGTGKTCRKPVALAQVCGIDNQDFQSNSSDENPPSPSVAHDDHRLLFFLPPFTARGVTSPQFVDAGDRIVALLSMRRTGLPSNETGLREMVSEVESGVRDLDGRLGAVRTSKFTAKKKVAHESRLKCFTALRGGAQGIVTDPDSRTPVTKRELAAVVLEPVTRLGAALREKTRAETSTALRLLFKECDKTEVQAALKETDLLRFYVLLKGAHQEYVQLLREEGRPEADPESGADAGSEALGDSAGAVDAKPAATVPATAGLTQRELKDGIVELLETVFKTMAFHAAKGREPYHHLLANAGPLPKKSTATPNSA